MMDYYVRSLTTGDQAQVAAWMVEHWAADRIAVHGVAYQPSRLPGFAAQAATGWVGLATYRVEGEAWELVSLDSAHPGMGVGTALLEAVVQAARQAGGRRLWLITTNDNLGALQFYMKRGFALVAVHRNAVAAARQLKPEIPWVGEHGLPIRDELELERWLQPG